MRFFNNVLAIGLVGVVFGAGTARGVSAGQEATASTAAKVDDGTLKSRIAANLKRNATIAARELEVDVNAGVVTLKGAVQTADEKTRAARLATIRGVTEVRNEIVVDAATAKAKAGKAIDSTKQAGDTAAAVTKGVAQSIGDKTKEIAGKAATKTKAVASATGEAITDDWITTKVKTKFLDEALLKGSDINVDTNDHVVTLKGTVGSSAASERAAVIAGSTEGVTRVLNQLVVKVT
jgi:hyperosmotically inducible protein